MQKSRLYADDKQRHTSSHSVPRKTAEPSHTGSSPSNSETSLADTLLRLQQTHGNQYVQRLIASMPRQQQVVQRYFMHTPGAQEATPAHFEAQQKRAGSNDFLNIGQTAPNIVPHNPGGNGVQIPPLRVSDDGNMAVEATDLSQRQSKVFFATPGIVAQSNARLQEINSPVKLHVDQANAVTINANNGAGLAIAGRQLDRIVPQSVAAPANTGTGYDVSYDLCNQVAESITNSGTLGGLAKVQGKDTQISSDNSDYRVIRYINARKAGQNHQTAVAGLNTPLVNPMALALGYNETVEPAVKTAKDMEALNNLGPTYWATIDGAFGNYLVSRNGGANHAGSIGTLALLGLTPSQVSKVETSYDSVKIPEIANHIFTNADAATLVQNHTGNVPVAPTVNKLERYARRRMGGLLPATAFELSLQVGTQASQAAYATEINREYNNAIGANVMFTAADMRNAFKLQAPELSLEQKIRAYVEDRHNGNNDAHAQGILGVAVPANVLALLDAAYNAATAGQNPAVTAAALQTALQDLGVNRFAAPEIGQIFGSTFTGNLDANNEVLDYKSGRSLHAGSTGFSTHYGAVVGKSAGDSITLENYTRIQENTQSVGAKDLQYYFQMYGTAVGQSWHDVWTGASRPVMNAVTMVFGENKQTVWKGQLDQIPVPVAGITVPNYQTLLTNQKGLIDAAPDAAAVKIAYHNALDVLTLASLQRHRQVADQKGHKNSLGAHLTLVNALNDVATVSGELGQWINHYTQALANTSKYNPLKRKFLNSKIDKLTLYQAKLNALHIFHQAHYV